MITYDSSKGPYLLDEVAKRGHSLWWDPADQAWHSSDDAAVQALINTFDPLPPAQQAAEQRVDAAAGEARARYITVAPGQEAVYNLKLQQAKDYQAAGNPADATPWPLINQEATARGVSPSQVATEIITTANQWIQIAAQIEAIRMKAKADIKAATTWQQCEQIASQA
ncbi:hypothetical protein D6833_00385, partial [Candidatus Parcubacteria bacterium]